MKNKFIRYLTMLIIFGNVYTNILVSPINNDVLNYIHIPFEWEQFPDATEYNIEVSGSELFDDIILTDTVNSTVLLDIDNFDWNHNYYWRVRPLYANNSVGEWTEINSFQTGLMIDNDSTLYVSESEIYNEDLLTNEYVFWGEWNPPFFSLILDLDGKEVWNNGEIPFVILNINNFGEILGSSNISYPNNSGIKINYNEEILWNTDYSVNRHDFIQLPNGNYLGSDQNNDDWYEYGPIPIGEWTGAFQEQGFTADGLTYEFPFKGNKLIELDENTKEIVWSWNAHDYFSKLDTDLHGGQWENALINGNLDWLHFNAFSFDESENDIYISYRHLSRITKIDYPSGELIWNMGLEAEAGTGNNNICSDLEFSYQHDIRVMDDGTLLFFDNGNLDIKYFNQDEMTSRLIRVEVIDDSYCNTIFEYELPTELKSYGMGSVQLLDNGNYVINTLGGGGTILEIDGNNGELISKMSLNMSEPNYMGSNYRGFKVPSVHPSIFSVIAENYTTVELNNSGIDTTFSAIEINDANNFIKFIIRNHSGYTQPYQYELDDISGFFSEYDSGEISIPPYDVIELIFESTTSLYDLSTINFNIYPLHHPYLEKSLNFNIFHNLILGDINDDGNINVFDVVIMVDYILSAGFSNNADLNLDGIINIQDIILLINLIINLQ